MSGRLFPALALAAACLLTSALAHADTVVYQSLYRSDGAVFTAVDDYGDYVILDQNATCANNNPCYTASIGGQVHYDLDSAPTLPSNPNAAAGPGCGVTSAGFYTIATTCKNGYEFLFALANADAGIASIYAASDPNDPLGPVYYPGSYILTDNGSLYFENSPGDYLGSVLDVTTTTAATPEPSSIALLGTGLLGIAGTLKRRYA